jgi:hypothetical protein
VKRVLKYAITPGRVFPLTVPYKNFKVLCVQEQHGRPQLWALVDEEKDFDPNAEYQHDFFIFDTGSPIFDPEFEEIGEYVGTFQLKGGDQVFHVFEALKWTPGS